jgi:hypothetical protein
MKKRFNWGILLWASFFILINIDWKNFKYLPNLLKELQKLFHKNSRYTEDNSYVLIHKTKLKDL